MSLELQGFHNQINQCQRCSELKIKVPLLFMPNTDAKIMVVTQGPKGERVSKDEICELKRGILSPANIFMYPFLYTVFNGKFRPDGEIDKEPSTAYWTHIRKCFMEGEKRKILNRCSGAYLREEIRIVNPKLIIAIGGWAARFFAEYNESLREALKIGLENAFWQQEDVFYRFKNSELSVGADLVILPHPSGQNARLWKGLGRNRRTVTILENLRKTVAATLQQQTLESTSMKK